MTNMIYNKNLDKVYTDIGAAPKVDTVIDNSGAEAVSSPFGQTVEEKIEDLEKTTSNENEETVQQVSTNEQNLEENNSSSEENTNNNETKTETPVEVEAPKDPVFTKPVEGTMMKEYAKDKLVYSETLKEWVVHTGVDIAAEKTTVVKAAESGTVTAIKNDPRYGITVIIAHANGYETRYANLLTAEFITVGEKVEQGQTIGTVGNTATFEIMDESHLHFEILKDGEYLDPIVFVEI